MVNETRDELISLTDEKKNKNLRGKKIEKKVERRSEISRHILATAICIVDLA